MKHYKLTCLIFSIALLNIHALSAQPATTVKLCGKIAQGEILNGYAPEFKSVIVNGVPHQLTENGAFIIAFQRDQQKQTPITFITKSGEKIENSLNIAATKWDIQNLKGLPPRKVTPSKEDEAAINDERIKVRGSLTGNTAQTDWQKGFIEPVHGRISGYFGGQRIMNGKKMNPHLGTDIAAPIGTPVKAAADGIVTLNAPDTFYSGNVIVLDHGHGLQTIYAHLNTMNVKKGDIVKQGDVIGEVGKTGRVTGPHLHWGASLRGTRFNPYSLLNLNKNDNICINL